MKKITEKKDKSLITYQNQNDIVTKIKTKSLKEICGVIVVKTIDDINEPLLPPYDQW